MNDQEWFENEAFWQNMYPFMFPPERFELAGEQIVQILALTGLQAGDVLDLACGPGRHCVALAQLGFSVTGVDRTPFLLEKARERARTAGVDVEFVTQDMRDFVRPAAFDLVLSLFTSFGYFEQPEEDRQVLINVCQSLRPGGALLMDVMGKEPLARVFLPATVTDGPGGAKLIQQHEIRADWTRIYNEWTIVGIGPTITFQFEHTVYSGRELKELLLAAGFAEVTLFGDLAGSPYNVHARRLVALARKR